MDTFNAISKRTSVRAYQKKSVTDDFLEKIVDAGRRAPTARAVEPWEFVVIRDRKTLEELANLAEHGRFIKDSAACIAVFCKDTKYYLEDGSAATENMLIAAADLGLGACWVAGDKKPYAADVSGLLNAPQDCKLVSMISLGWPEKDVEQPKKRPLENVIHWEKF